MLSVTAFRLPFSVPFYDVYRTNTKGLSVTRHEQDVPRLSEIDSPCTRSPTLSPLAGDL